MLLHRCGRCREEGDKQHFIAVEMPSFFLWGENDFTLLLLPLARLLKAFLKPF